MPPSAVRIVFSGSSAPSDSTRLVSEDSESKEDEQAVADEHGLAVAAVAQCAVDHLGDLGGRCHVAQPLAVAGEFGAHGRDEDVRVIPLVLGDHEAGPAAGSDEREGEEGQDDQRDDAPHEEPDRPPATAAATGGGRRRQRRGGQHDRQGW